MYFERSRKNIKKISVRKNKKITRKWNNVHDISFFLKIAL